MRALFTERLNHYAPQLKVQWRKLALSSAGTLWGTAHSDGSIRLNWRLVHQAAGDRLRGGARTEPPAGDGPQPALLGHRAHGGAELPELRGHLKDAALPAW